MELVDAILGNKLLAAAGALAVLFITHRLSIARESAAHARIAGAAIAEAFRPELDSLVQSGGNAGLVLNDVAFKKHEAAIRNNIGRLSLITRVRLHFAWRSLAYRSGHEFYAQYFDAGSLDRRRKLLPLARKRIQRIISLVT